MCRSVQAETKAAASQDPFTFYKTYLDTNVPVLGDQHNLESGDDGYTCRFENIAAHGSSVDDAQSQARGHTASYKLAVRLSNRSNGAPLATIIEQGSYSTLNSHGSLLSVGRFPSLKAAENGSPTRGSRRRSRSLDEKALHDIEEDLVPEHDIFAVAVSDAGLNEEHAVADLPSCTATPLTSYQFETQQSLSSHSEDELIDHEDRGVKGFIRGVMRGVSKTRSRTSSIVNVPIIEHRERPHPTLESNLQLLGQGRELTHPSTNGRIIPSRASEGATHIPKLEDQTRNRAISLPDFELAAHVHPTLTRSRSGISEANAGCGFLLPTLPCQNATRLHEPLFLTPVVHAGTRDVARKNRTVQASTSHTGMFDSSAQCTYKSIAIHGGEPSAVRDPKSAKNVFADQNASFCSTISTSYSGTVLGVDVDLQHDFSHSTRRSQSPPTPVWFTPQMAELERQASYSDSPASTKASESEPTQVTCRSITSSALTSLLPIAAASGIVRPNYDTPKISFYSPSGNLIQPESSSPPGTSPSDYGSSPTVTTSHYNRQSISTTYSAESPPDRPPLIPMTTPPTQKIPLPPHLLYHHNCRGPEPSSINTLESSVRSVKGCDGIICEDSLTPRSGICLPHKQARVHRSTRLAVHDLKAEANFYKARLIASVAAHPFVPAMHKGKTLQKRCVHDYNTYARKPHMRAPEIRRVGYREGVLGLFAAHALRVCFCQPYDGVGPPTRANTVGTHLTGDADSLNSRPCVSSRTKEAEFLLPNARIVNSSSGHSRCSMGMDSNSQSQGDSTHSSSSCRASYTRTAKRKVG